MMMMMRRFPGHVSKIAAPKTLNQAIATKLVEKAFMSDMSAKAPSKRHCVGR